MGVQIRQGGAGPFLEGTVTGQVPTWNETTQSWDVSSGIFTRGAFVFIEDYLPGVGGDLRLAMIAAQAANTDAGVMFVGPLGTYSWSPGTTFQPRNNTIWSMYGTTIELDMDGATSGQQFIFLRIDVGVGTHPDRIQLWGGRYRLLNVVTSFFSAAFQLDGCSNCVVKDVTGECTFDAAATQGRIRWGFNLLGGDQSVDITQGRNNRFDNCTLKFSQIQGCGAGRSADGVMITNTQIDDANDLGISVVSGDSDQSLQNVSILNTQCRNVGGNGVVLVGTDGQGTAIGCGVLRNICVDGVWLDGERSTPDLDFDFSTAVVCNGGLVTENVVVTNIGTKLAPNASTQARSVVIASQDDETSWHGLTVSNAQLGVVTSDDPLEALYISGLNLFGVTLSNVRVRGVRGIRVINADGLNVDNCQTENGSLLLTASRDLLLGTQISNSNFTRTTGFQACVQFSSSNFDFAKVQLSNVICNGNNVPIGVGLAGGTMQMSLSNIENTSNSNPTAETLAGIIRAVNIRGFVVITTVSVTVPAVVAGSVGYVDVSMAGTRLADLAVGESVVVNPTADLVAAGVGGGFINARVSATGSVRCAYLGPLAGGASNHSFARAA